MTESSSERPTQLQRRDSTRSRLLEAATELFSRSGYHGTQVMDIVTKARVSAGTFYRYFEDKQAIFFAIAEELAEHELAEAKKANLAMSATNDFTTTVSNLVQYYEAHFERVMARADLYRCLLHSGVVDPEQDHLWQMNQRTASELAEHLRAIGIVDTSQHESLARMLLSVSAGLRFSMLHSGAPTPAQAARLSARFIVGALAGFTTRWPSELKPSIAEWSTVLNAVASLE